MRISKNITYKEAIHSNTAKRLGIDNTPNDQQIANMKVIAEKVFEPLRQWVGGPIKVTSFFRSVETNKAIGGSSRSQHCLGCALDLDDVFGYKTNAEMFYYIKEYIDFDQLIWEFGDDNNPNWIHVSYVEDNNRGRVLKAEKIDGKTNYRVI